MVKTILQEQQRKLLEQERHLAHELQACLVSFEGAEEAHRATLQQITASLEDLFLLVVVGEFNAGKSACINTLLRQEVLEEGVIPTTHQITIVRYGPAKKQILNNQNLLEIEYPANFLHDVSMVDTPGVNAVYREHERLTEEFVPRSDLLLFITSADRPFTQSERLFLERIRAWGKKIVIIVNKIDLLRTPRDQEQVITFMRDNCKRLLGFEPQIFPVSALLAYKAQAAMGHDAVALWEQSRFGPLEDYLFRTYDAGERVLLKLLSPLSVMNRLLTQTRTALEQHITLLAEDARTVSTIDQQLQLYREDMGKNFSHRLGEIENIILEMRMRGDRFLDETIRLGRVLDLMRSGRIQEEFDRDVVGDTAQHIDQAIQELIDWLVEHEQRLWQDVMEYLDRRRKVSIRRDSQLLGSVSRQFDYNRRTLLQSVAQTASRVIQSYDRRVEAMELSQDLRAAVTQAALAGAGGISLGAFIVVLVGTAIADVTGIFAGAVLFGLGLYIIPARRRRVKQEFETKMEELRQRLHQALSEQFNKQLNYSLTRVQDAITPYTRFVRAEQQKTTEIQSKIVQLNHQILSLKSQIESIN